LYGDVFEVYGNRDVCETCGPIACEQNSSRKLHDT